MTPRRLRTVLLQHSSSLICASVHNSSEPLVLSLAIKRPSFQPISLLDCCKIYRLSTFVRRSVVCCEVVEQLCCFAMLEFVTQCDRKGRDLIDWTPFCIRWQQTMFAEFMVNFMISGSHCNLNQQFLIYPWKNDYKFKVIHHSSG